MQTIVREYTEQEQAEMGRKLAKVFHMKRDPQRRDRWQTTWGNKTDLGLFRTIVGVVEEIKDGKPGDLLEVQP
jgi:hypothetical protein